MRQSVRRPALLVVWVSPDPESAKQVVVSHECRVATMTKRSGTWCESSGEDVPPDEARTAWTLAARPVLMTAAQKYGEFVTYKQLAEAVQRDADIMTTQRQDTWISNVLDSVAKECAAKGEPLLSAFAVQTNQTVGAGYSDERHRGLRRRPRRSRRPRGRGTAEGPRLLRRRDAGQRWPRDVAADDGPPPRPRARRGPACRAAHVPELLRRAPGQRTVRALRRQLTGAHLRAQLRRARSAGSCL